MDKLITFFLDRSFVVNLISVFVLFLGVFSLSSMNRDLMPMISQNEVRVRVNILGASAEEMERHVTFPIEQVLQSLVGLDKLTSVSSLGKTDIRISYKGNYEEMDQAASLVESQIEAIRYKLPQEIRKITVERVRQSMVFLSYMGLRGLQDGNTEHRQFLRTLERRALAIDGVVKVRTFVRDRDVYVNFDSKKLAANEISILQAKRSLKDAVRISPIGIYKEIGKETGVQIAKSVSSIKDIQDLTLSTNMSGQVVRLKDVATVNFGLGKEYDLFYIDGQESAGFVVRKSMNTDIIEIKEKFAALVDELNQIAPAGVEVVYLVDGPRFIEQQLSLLSRNSLIGLVIVLGVLMLFLNWKTALWTGFGVPLSYAGTIVILHAMGIQFDLLSIVGIILVLGILVDDAIIVSEKYTDFLQKGLAPRDAARSAVKKLILPVSGTVLTTLVAFAPLIFLKSEMSKFLLVVPAIVIISLSISWFESFFILPNHLMHYVRVGTTPRQDRFFSVIKSFYIRVLRTTLQFRYLILIGFLAVTGVAGFLAKEKVRQSFGMHINREKITIFSELKDAKNLTDARAKLKGIEDFLRSLDKNLIDHSTTGIGFFWTHGRVLRGLKYAKLTVFMSNDSLYPERDKKILMPQIQKFVENYKEKTGYFAKLYIRSEKQGADEMRTGLISVSIKGDDEVEFSEIENEISKAVTVLPSITEYLKDMERVQDTWKFFPDQEKLARYGLSAFNVSSQIRGQFTPDEIAEIRIYGENVFVFSDVDHKESLSMANLNKMEVASSRGISVPLSLLGVWKKVQTLKTIAHRSSLRNLTMDFIFDDKNKEGINVAESKRRMVAALAPIVKKYPRYDILVKDGDEQEAKNKAWALKVAVVCILGVMFVMALVLGSIVQPFIVCLPIPFGLVGIIFALYFHNMPLGVMALIGLVGTVGVAVNDSIVMMDEINSQRKEKGRFDKSVIISGASSRLRAILLTTVTTLGGVFPMAYAIGGESGFTQPLAFSMGWGLSFATFLTLFILPSLLMVQIDVTNGFVKIFGRKKTSVTTPEDSFGFDEEAAPLAGSFHQSAGVEIGKMEPRGSNQRSGIPEKLPQL